MIKEDARPLVLIVDDSTHVTGPLRILFEETGRRVVVADSVAAAVRACEAERPDLMLLDVSLPDGDGLAVLEILRGTPALPVVSVALTGHDDELTVQRCRAAGCRDVLLKPVPVRDLLRHAAEWLPERIASA
ncbi:MAG TPA: response regulator [Gemmatimonadaceae bacterium]|nr:response regulator [Gemmatimonadaceae bacterium]